MEAENKITNLLITISILVVLIAGCKSSQTSDTNVNSLGNEKLLDSLVSTWESNNSIYLKGLKEEVKEERDIKHIENMQVYSQRASKGYGKYEPRRKSFLRFLFSNYNIEAKDFIIRENFQGEKVFYEFINEKEKKIFQNIIENWSEIKNERITDFKNLANNVKTFERNHSCATRSFSFSLITLFSQEGVDTKLDDRSCQSIDI